MGFQRVEIRAEGVACRRGERLLFRDFGLTAACGTLTEIVGPNGAGKSSLLRILAGLLKAESGTVAVIADGRALGRDDEPPSSLMHYLGHLDALKNPMTARENLVFAARWFGAAHGPDAALERVGLAAQGELPVGYLSAGQRRRLALGRCWMLGRPLWLLDEPTAALDPARAAAIAELVRRLAGEGLTMVVTTHDVALVRRLADRAVLLVDGAVVGEGAPDAVVARWEDEPAWR